MANGGTGARARRDAQRGWAQRQERRQAAQVGEQVTEKANTGDLSLLAQTIVGIVVCVTLLFAAVRLIVRAIEFIGKLVSHRD